MFFRFAVLTLFFSVAWCSLSAPDAGADEPPASASEYLHPRRLVSEFLPNLVQVHPRVLSGGLPADAKAFVELVDRKVRVIVSVDGAKPDVDIARAHGLRYIHLPIGYGGIHPARVMELAKVVHDYDDVIYIHCHHGKHRAAAAAAVACIASGRVEPDQAVEVLDVAGTDKVYQGLFRVVRQTQRVPDSELEALVVDYREIADVPPMAEAMATIEQTFVRVERLATDRQSLATEVSLMEARQDVRLLRQQLSELLRTQDMSEHAPGFRKRLHSSVSSVEKLEAMMVDEEAGDDSTLPRTRLLKQVQRISQSCVDCHTRHRDRVDEGALSRLNR
ncbi:MAG: hypothetical protein AAFU85_05485 [Planctomycetota bacterium]